VCKSCSGRHFYGSCQATQTENLGNTKLAQETAPKTKVNVSHTICFNVHKEMKNSIKYILKEQHKHFSFIAVSLLHNGHQHVSGHLQGGENKNKKYNYNSRLNEFGCEFNQRYYDL
jgi:hypothetical protein